MPAVHDFHALRSHLGLPPVERTDQFPDDVMAEATRIAEQAPDAPADLTAVPFVTIDPPGSMDLDQAVHLERVEDGFRIKYAIADLGVVIEPGGHIDTEARRRGQTVYLPDGRVPLHPPVLSEDALSLLPDQVRRAVVWTIDVDAEGAVADTSVERATVRSVARLDYAGVQAAVDAGSPHPSIEPLRDLGELRRRVRLDAGAIDLAMPAQEVVATGDDWTVRLEARTRADAWNAEISLVTGMAAADMMLKAKIGLLRFLPAPGDDDVKDFLALADRLGIAVDGSATPGQVLAGLDMEQPASLALTAQATRLLRGAGYVAFDGELPEVSGHAGIGGAYAHVTAPLRRLSDRFSTEICLAISAGRKPDERIRDALEAVAEAMRDSDRLASSADRGAIDQTEVWVMEQRRDDTFEAVVLRAGSTPDSSADIMVLDPLVLSECVGDGLEPGRRVKVSVSQIDQDQRRVTYVTR